MQRLKVVLLLQDLFFGGTQRHALELAARLNRDRFDVALWTLIGGEDFLPQARDYGLTVRRLGRGETVGPRDLLALWRALRADTPDLLLPLTVVPNIWGRVLGRLAGVPVIIGNCRGARDCGLQHEWLLRHLADHVLCNAAALKERLTQTFHLPPQQVSVIRNGVNTEIFVPPAAPRSENPVILCVARLAPVKDHPTLLGAFDRLAGNHPRAELWLVGDGPAEDAVRGHVAKCRFRDRIKLLPGQADLRPLYGRATVLVLSSRHEGLPNVVLEAMASGLPVVATAVGGLPELVADGVTGRLVPPGQPQALAEALGAVLDDPAGSAAMGAAARQRAVADFSLDTMARRHEEAFLRVMGSKGRGRNASGGQEGPGTPPGLPQ